MNKFYTGDNLHALRTLDNASVDLVYLDPPFNSGRDYDDKEGAFTDTWKPDTDFYENLKFLADWHHTGVSRVIETSRDINGEPMGVYLTFMAVRLIELHRVLKPTGSIYLHCDGTASHYLKLLMDAIFGGNRFLNDISWLRSQPKNNSIKNFSRCRDTILRYAKSTNYTFTPLYTALDEKYIQKSYTLKDADGRLYQLDNLLSPSKNDSSVEYEFLGVKRVWRWSPERMQEAYAQGLIVQTKPGSVPRYKRYLDQSKGRIVTDNWDDIPAISSSNLERLDYPTQKPEALLERIISASSNDGDVVLDPFSGSGTTCVIAQKLRRTWIGMDMNTESYPLLMKRFKAYRVFPAPECELTDSREAILAL